VADGGIPSRWALMAKNLILHVRATNFFGGPEKQILEHACRSRNYRHSVVTFVDGNRPNELLERCRKSSISVHAVEAGNPFNPSTIIKLRRIIAALKPSLICSHGYRSTILLPLSAFGMRIPIIAFARGSTGENRKVELYESLERVVLPHLKGIICVCEAQRRQLEEAGVRAPHWWVVHNGVSSPSTADLQDLNRLRKELGIYGDEAVIVCSGRLSPEKGQNDLLRAIQLVPNGGRKNTFLFCGEGPCRNALEEEAKHLGILDRVQFLGHRRDIMEIYQIMDLLVLPSHTEGLPNAVLEALSCGKPVVATRVGGVPEVVEDGQNGLLVLANRPDMLAEAIASCLASPEKMKSMGKAGKDLVLSRFSFEEQARKLESAYECILHSS
jgi:glycosyltransferase involved in cell wall biosynthesis